MKRLACLMFAALTSSASAGDVEYYRKYIRDLGGIEEFVKMTAAKSAKNLPQQLDSETRLLQVQASGKTLAMTHQLINVKSMKEGERQQLKIAAIEMMSKKVCTNELGKLFVSELDMRYFYLYLTNSGESLFTFDVNRNNCAPYR